MIQWLIILDAMQHAWHATMQISGMVAQELFRKVVNPIRPEPKNHNRMQVNPKGTVARLLAQGAWTKVAQDVRARLMTICLLPRCSCCLCRWAPVMHDHQKAQRAEACLCSCYIKGFQWPFKQYTVLPRCSCTLPLWAPVTRGRAR